MAIDHVTHLIIVDCQPLNSNQLPNGKKENLKSVMKGLQVAIELADFFLICECVRSNINFHPGNQDVDFDMLEIFFSSMY